MPFVIEHYDPRDDKYYTARADNEKTADQLKKVLEHLGMKEITVFEEIVTHREIKGVDTIVTVELSEKTINRIEEKLYEGESLDEQLNDLLDDMDLFEEEFYGTTVADINNGRKKL